MISRPAQVLAASISSISCLLVVALKCTSSFLLRPGIWSLHLSATDIALVAVAFRGIARLLSSSGLLHSLSRLSFLIRRRIYLGRKRTRLALVSAALAFSG